MLNKIYNCLFNKNFLKQINKNNNCLNEKDNNLNKNDNCLNEKDNNLNKNDNYLNEKDNNLINLIYDSCVNLYDPNKNNYLEIENKFYLEFTYTFNDITYYSKYKEILLEKILEKKYISDKKNKFDNNNILDNNNKYIEYYCVYMSTNEIIKIYKTDYLLRLIDNNQNILYCFEYIDINQSTIEKIMEKYSKLYTCKIELC